MAIAGCIVAMSALIAVSVCSPTLHAQTTSHSRVQTDTVRSQSLRINLIGDTPDREVLIYLPAAYFTQPTRRLPVLYLLHGMTSHPSEWFDGSYQGFDLQKAMDSLAKPVGAEYIVVMPAADNSFGGTFYVNSSAFGNWEDFIANELVRYVDTRFRTMANRRKRAIAGQSMGGFGALFLAYRHPEKFGSVYAMSPCCLGFVGEFAPDSVTWTLPSLDSATLTRVQAGQLQRARAMAAAFAAPRRSLPRSSTQTANSMSPARSPLPYNIGTSNAIIADQSTLLRWRAHMPIELARRNLAPYKQMCAIGLDFGVSDQISSVPSGTRAFAGALDRGRVAFTMDAYQGGHVDQARERFEHHVLPFFARVFSRGDATSGCSTDGAVVKRAALTEQHSTWSTR